MAVNWKCAVVVLDLQLQCVLLYLNGIKFCFIALVELLLGEPEFDVFDFKDICVDRPREYNIVVDSSLLPQPHVTIIIVVIQNT